jgi:hypothetical protein
MAHPRDGRAQLVDVVGEVTVDAQNAGPDVRPRTLDRARHDHARGADQ